MKRHVLILAIMLLCVIGIPSNLLLRNVFPLPSVSPPPPPQPPEHHPHWTPGLANYAGNNGAVTWARNWDNCVQNPDGVAHQHHDTHDFQGATNTTDPGPEPYSAWAVWDNRVFRVDDNGDFDFGHGFINEWLWLGGGADQIPRFSFSPMQRDGVTPCNWPAQAQAGIREAFGMWDGIGSDKNHLVVGIAFREALTGEQSEIVLYWEPWANFGEVVSPPVGTVNSDWIAGGMRTVEVVFGSEWPWFYGNDPALTPANQYHFLRVAIHEVGHVVGLDEQNDVDDVMYRWMEPAPIGPFFNTIDNDSIDGVRDLYSIPQYDFGDAPDPYPVRCGNNGAYALVIDKEWLGPSPAGVSTTSMERDPPPQPYQDFPDDGCVFDLAAGTVTITVSVTNHNSPRYAGTYDLYVAVWIDWNCDKDWKDADELIVLDRLSPQSWAANTKTETYSFNVSLDCQETWARARLVYANTGGYLAGNAGDEGLLSSPESPDNGGEIEDYKLTPLADYGDAPDDTQNPGTYAYLGVVANFPSLYDTDNSRVTGRRGPYHKNTSMYWLGSQSSVTTTLELDAKITNLDNDDCNLRIYVNHTNRDTWFLFDVTISSQADDIVRYVNILYDMNRDGKWYSQILCTEWMVQNKPLFIPPGNTLRVVCCFPFNLSEVNCWTRITLTDETIDPATFGAGGWDGSGPSIGFASGETEDWLATPIRLDPPEPDICDVDPKDIAIMNTLRTIRYNLCHVKIPCNNNPPGKFIFNMRNPGCRDLTFNPPIVWIRVRGLPVSAVDIKPTDHIVGVGPHPPPPWGNGPPIGRIPLPKGQQISIWYEGRWKQPCVPKPYACDCPLGHACCSRYNPIVNLDPENVTYYYEPDEPYETQSQFFTLPPEEPPKCVGGMVDLYQWSLPIPWIALSVIVAAIAVTTAYVSKWRRRKTTQKD